MRKNMTRILENIFFVRGCVLKQREREKTRETKKQKKMIHIQTQNLESTNNMTGILKKILQHIRGVSIGGVALVSMQTKEKNDMMDIHRMCCHIFNQIFSWKQEKRTT